MFIASHGADEESVAGKEKKRRRVSDDEEAPPSGDDVGSSDEEAYRMAYDFEEEAGSDSDQHSPPLRGVLKPIKPLDGYRDMTYYKQRVRQYFSNLPTETDSFWVSVDNVKKVALAKHDQVTIQDLYDNLYAVADAVAGVVAGELDHENYQIRFWDRNDSEVVVSDDDWDYYNESFVEYKEFLLGMNRVEIFTIPYLGDEEEEAEAASDSTGDADD